MRVTSGPGGLAVAAITNDCATASVALQGAHVLSFQPRDTRPVLWVSKESLFTEGKPIRGGIPICWPWFGPHPTDADKPAHGFARTSLWSLLPGDDGRIRLRLTDSDRTRAIWPHAFELELAVAAGLSLGVTLAIRNPGPAPFTCSGALHTYFAVSDIGHVRVDGLDGCAYLDKVAAYTRRTQTGPVVIAEETDRIYVDTTADCAIVDPAWSRVIRVAKRGSRTTVVWNPWIARARQLADFGDDEYHEMLCVETAMAGDDHVTVDTGAEHVLSTTISVSATPNSQRPTPN